MALVTRPYRLPPRAVRMTVMRDSHDAPNSDPRGDLNRRKEGHIEACLDSSVDLGLDSFDGVKLLYNTLPEIALDDVSMETDFAGRTIAAPLIISSMTGGVGDEFLRINRNLALGAETLKIPLGLGSMKVMLRDETAVDSFLIRDLAPSVPIIANLGLVSFNYGIGWDDVARIVERVQPDVFGLHLNALQESIQEGGDTDFRGLKARLEDFVARSKLPVYVKECGGGIAPQVVETIAATGVQFIDISGNDGNQLGERGSLSQPGPGARGTLQRFWPPDEVDSRTGPQGSTPPSQAGRQWRNSQRNPGRQGIRAGRPLRFRSPSIPPFGDEIGRRSRFYRKAADSGNANSNVSGGRENGQGIGPNGRHRLSKVMSTLLRS